MSRVKKYKSIDEISQLIYKPNFHNSYKNIREWGGAGVIITSQPLPYPTDKIVIVTSHASALSWLFKRIGKYTVLPEYVYKYELYGNLAKSAIRYQYDCLSTEQKKTLNESEQQQLFQFLDSDSSKFSQPVMINNYGYQLDSRASEENRPQNLLTAVWREAERMLNDYYVNLFVYGTLMNRESNHVYLKNAKALGTEEVNSARLYDLGAYPMMLHEGNSTVCGELYQISLKTLHLLDSLEGHPHYFRRELITLNSGIQAVAYLGRAEMASELVPVIKSGNWRER